MSAPDEPSPPSSWPELEAQFVEIAAMNAATLEYLTRDLTPDTVDSPFVGTNFARSVEVLVRAELFGAGAELARFDEHLAEFGRLVAYTRSSVLDAVVDHNLAAIGLADLLEATERQVVPDDGLVDRPLARLAAIPPEHDDGLRQATWAMLAHGRVEGIDALLGDDPASAPPDPREDFAGAVWTIQRHMARCLHHGADLEMALPAWREYLEFFPLNVLAEQATYTELLWAARSVHVAVGGGDPSSLLDWIRDQIR